MPFKCWFEKIYDVYFERLYRNAFAITKSKDLAEDVVEEVFLNIWKGKNGHLTIKDLDSYLYTAVKHTAIRTLSKESGNFLYAKLEDSPGLTDTIDPESLLLGHELQKIVAEAIRDLPPHCSLVYDMVKNQGMSHAEVSRELQISKKTVENHICKALARIKDQLAKYFDHSDMRLQLIPEIGMILVVLCSFLVN